MELKIGSRIFNVTNKDSILDNGKIYILHTQWYLMDWSRVYPKISKTLFKSLLSEGKIKLSEKKYTSTFTGETYDLYEFVEDEHVG